MNPRLTRSRKRRQFAELVELCYDPARRGKGLGYLFDLLHAKGRTTMATPGIRFPALMILHAGFLIAVPAAADTPASTESATRQRSVDPEILLATPAAPGDIRGFQAGDSVTLVRESADYKRVVIYVYAGDERWQLVSNSLKAKTAP